MGSAWGAGIGLWGVPHPVSVQYNATGVAQVGAGSIGHNNTHQVSALPGVRQQ